MSRYATMYDFEKCAPENQSYHKKLMKKFSVAVGAIVVMKLRILYD